MFDPHVMGLMWLKLMSQLFLDEVQGTQLFHYFSTNHHTPSAVFDTHKIIVNNFSVRHHEYQKITEMKRERDKRTVRAILQSHWP